MAAKRDLTPEERERRREDMRQRNADPDFRRRQAEGRAKRAEGKANSLAPPVAPSAPGSDEPIDLLVEYRKIVRDPSASPKQRMDALTALGKLEDQEPVLGPPLDHEATYERIIVRVSARSEKTAQDRLSDLEQWLLAAYPPLIEPEPERESEPEHESDPESREQTQADIIASLARGKRQPAKPAKPEPVGVLAGPPEIAAGPPVRQWGAEDGTGAGREHGGLERPSYY